MSAHGTEPNTEPLLYPDAEIEAYMADVDRTILRENLRQPMTWRFQNFSAFARSVQAFRKNIRIVNRAARV
ncbi:MAG: hypothetical protein M3Y80_07315 [Verrucomicrobiota bacterium]|nr:hypothetical protein [Verrucomicrobiota bacterium]